MSAQPFTAYVENVRTKHTRQGAIKLPMEADMRSRWNARVEPRSLATLGRAGAAAYLADYGKGISAGKCEALALFAESQGQPAFAAGFWARAYELTFGSPPDVCETNAPGTPAAFAPAPAANEAESVFPSFPTHLQPGKVVTMQPVDAPQEIEAYLRDPMFWAQPKRDGERMMLFADDQCLAGQARSGRIVPVPVHWRTAIKKVVRDVGAFLLDGERVYLDAAGGEHRSGAQAATKNIQLGRGSEPPVERYCVFKALFFNGRDLTSRLESLRMTWGQEVGHLLAATDPECFEFLYPAVDSHGKLTLLEQQQHERREGIVLVRTDVPYIGGKSNGPDAPYVRYKFLKTIDVVVVGLTATTADGRPFGAIEVAAYRDGVLVTLGRVGTGFTVDEAREIASAYAAGPGSLVIEIETQGFTENGRIWHARYKGIRRDKSPQECRLIE